MGDLNRHSAERNQLNVAIDVDVEAMKRQFSQVTRTISQSFERLRQQLKGSTDAMAAIKKATRGSLKVTADFDRLRETIVTFANGIVQQLDADLVSRGFPPAASHPDQWSHLARIIEKDPATVTRGEIFEFALAWYDRETIKARLLAQAQAGSVNAPEVEQDSMWSSSTLAEKFGLPRKALDGRLDRWRNRNQSTIGRDWAEASDRTTRGQKYTYRFGAIEHIVRAMLREE